MAVRLVLCFRTPPASRAGDESGLPGLLRDLGARSAVRGGQLVAWHGDGIAFGFPVEALPDLTDMLPEPPCTLFGVGLAVGELETVFELGRGAVAAMGPALVEATALSSLAEPGEALVSPMLASREPDLMAAEGEFGSHGGRVWRGMRLNLAQPWLPAPADALSRLDFDTWVGTLPSARLPLSIGARSVLVAAEGSGGTCFLRHLVGPENSSLWLTPAAAGEPLGALRRAFSRDPAWSKLGSPGPAARGPLERLLSGAGLTHEAAVALLRSWARAIGADGSAVVVIDEADRVDADTLEAVTEAARDAFAVVTRTHGWGVPEALASLPRCGELELSALDEEQSLELLRSFTGDALRGPLVESWARAGRSRLGSIEALCCALEEGVLVWAKSELVACRSGPKHASETDASYWIRRRLDRCDAEERAVLEVVALLGGEADSHELTLVADQVLGSGRSLADVTRQLVGRRWVRRTGERMVGLVGATHRRVLLEAMPAERRKQWHSLVVRLVGPRDRPLSAGVAAVHALLAGDDEQALASARRVALLLRLNAREATARAFDGLAKDLSLEPVSARGLDGALVAAAVRHVSDEPAERKHLATGSVRAGSDHLTAESDPADWTAGVSLNGTAAVHRGDGESVPAAAAPIAGTDAVETGSVAAASIDARQSGASGLPQGPPGADAGARGCRQHLALSLLFAKDDRFVEALPHALQALAIARETGDAHGEKACVMTLAALSRVAGQPAAAVAWEQRLRS